MELTYKQTFGTNWSFFAMEYYLGILNRTYQIFVTPNIIAGGFVNGVIAAPPGLLSYWFVPSRYARQKIVEKYEQLSPESEDFKRRSQFFNFQYPRTEIEEAWYDPTLKWGMGTVAHSGKLNIRLASGRKREFILLGLQQGREILQHLQQGYNPSRTIDFSEIHQCMKQIYEEPESLQVWMNLADLFHTQGEKAQERYCRFYIGMLKRYKRNSI
jgi:hypothetical protein